MNALLPSKCLAVCLLLLTVSCGPGGSSGNTLPITVSEDLAADATWTPSTGDCDVIVDGVPEIKSALVIEKGTKICFKDNSGLLVAANGSLKAVGTAEDPIVFTSTTATKGAWKGLAFLSVNNDNQLIHTEISYAGNASAFCCGFFISNENARAALVLGDYKDPAQVTVQDSKISHSGGYGLQAFTNAKLESFARNTFEANELAPVSAYIQHLSQLDAASVYGGGSAPNGKQFVRVLFDQPLASDTTIKKLDVPYSLGFGFPKSIFRVKAALTVSAGTRLEFEANSGMLVEADGTISTQGTSADRVVLTGRSATKGYWKGLALLSLGNTLTETELSYGGNADAFCCGFFEPGGGESTKANLVVGDYATTGGVTINNVSSIQSGGRGVTALHSSTVTQQGTNDLTTGNTSANLGL